MGRWERTHQDLQQAALTLFAARGYEATSTAEIAQAVGVSQMTLFRHFPTKAALVLQDPFDPVIARSVRARPPGEGPMRAVVEGIRQAWAELPPELIGALRTRLRIVAASAELSAQLSTSTQATAAAIGQALTARGVAPEAAGVAAAAVLAGVTAALLQWASSDDGDLPAAVDCALDVLAGSSDPARGGTDPPSGAARSGGTARSCEAVGSGDAARSDGAARAGEAAPSDDAGRSGGG